jgi:S-formylglutathione hydrolase FrmB
MGPTSGSLQAATIALAIAAAAAAALLWNRLPGPRPARLLARAGLLVFGQLMASVAILVWLNIANGGLIVSWQDLLGEQSVNGGVFAGQYGDVVYNPVPVTASVRYAPVPVAASVAARTALRRFRPAENGFEVTTLYGPASGIASQVFVWTPPQYTAEPSERFPVLELLHGVWGSPEGWTGPMNVVAHLEAAERSGSVHPYILVVPEVTPIRGHTTPRDNEECSDIPGDAMVDTWLTQDVRTMVLTDFRAEPGPSGWGLMGYSTGGFCAAKLILQHPDLYKAAVSLSGYYTPDSVLLRDDGDLDHADNPLWLVGHTRTPPVSLLMTASAQDRVDPPSECQQMIAAARANPLSQATEIQSFVAPVGGGHNQSAWEKMLPTAFSWLSRRLAGPS